MHPLTRQQRMESFALRPWTCDTLALAALWILEAGMTLLALLWAQFVAKPAVAGNHAHPHVPSGIHSQNASILFNLLVVAMSANLVACAATVAPARRLARRLARPRHTTYTSPTRGGEEGAAPTAALRRACLGALVLTAPAVGCVAVGMALGVLVPISQHMEEHGAVAEHGHGAFAAMAVMVGVVVLCKLIALGIVHAWSLLSSGVRGGE